MPNSSNAQEQTFGAPVGQYPNVAQLAASPLELPSLGNAPSRDLLSDADLIRKLVACGGPTPDDYEELDYLFERIHRLSYSGQISDPGLAYFRAAFGEALSVRTLQGFALHKPYGYAGDFEIIDRIYRNHRAAEARLQAWDDYFHRHAAPRAVRNRKTYFHRLLDTHSARSRPCRVLKIASGPGRGMYEWLLANPRADIQFDCVELDPRAIAFAVELNLPFANRIGFTQKNALRFRPRHRYDLIWAAGICDYFDDAAFRMLLMRLLPALKPDGELVVGNFSPNNPSRAYMEVVGDWRLRTRSAGDLCALAAQAGVEPEYASVGQEPEGVNLFLHVRTSNRCAQEPQSSVVATLD